LLKAPLVPSANREPEKHSNREEKATIRINSRLHQLYRSCRMECILFMIINNN
jgi:hypothetical protein